MMSQFQQSVMVNRPIEEVFDFTVDQVGAGRWQYKTVVELLSGEPNGAGSTYRRTVTKRDEEVVHTYALAEVNAPFGFRLQTTSGEPSFVHEYTFVAEGTTTRVAVAVESEGDEAGDIDNQLQSLARQLGEREAAEPMGEREATEPARRGFGWARTAFWRTVIFTPFAAVFTAGLAIPVVALAGVGLLIFGQPTRKKTGLQMLLGVAASIFLLLPTVFVMTIVVGLLGSAIAAFF
jgi:hypothetical protein